MHVRRGQCLRIAAFQLTADLHFHLQFGLGLRHAAVERQHHHRWLLQSARRPMQSQLNDSTRLGQYKTAEKYTSTGADLEFPRWRV